MGNRLGVLIVVGCLSVAVGSATAQTQTFITDYYKQSGYTNVPGAGGAEPVTAAAKLFEIMVTPVWPAFQICLYTETIPGEGADPNQKEIYAKKMKWEAFGDQSGDRLGKGNVSTKEGQVGCKTQTGFADVAAAAEEDHFIFWFVEFVMKGNRDYVGYYGPAIWTFPFLPSAAEDRQTVGIERLSPACAARLLSRDRLACIPSFVSPIPLTEWVMVWPSMSE